MAVPGEFLSAMESIHRDDINGAACLSRRAAVALEQVAGAFSPTGIAQAVDLIRNAKPTMAPLETLARRVSGSTGEAHLREICRQFLDESSVAEKTIARLAQPLIPQGATVLTHSSSSAVELALLLAAPPRVLATESEPAREGAALAARLRLAGIDATVIADADGVRAISNVGMLLVGADAISPRGVVNKVGTRALVTAAHEAGVPAWCLASSHKFTPHPLAIQPLFDECPLALFSGFVTDLGPLAPDELNMIVL